MILVQCGGAAQDRRAFGPHPDGPLILRRMMIMRRYSVNKRRSARKFRRNVGRTRRVNVKPQPMRGGWRL